MSFLIAGILARIGLRIVANAVVHIYQTVPGEIVRLDDGKRWPSTDFIATGNRRGRLDNFPIVHDSTGFTFGRVPESMLAGRLSGFEEGTRARLEASVANVESLVGDADAGRETVLLTVGDSNVRVNFEHLRQLFMPRRVVLSDSLGVPHTGPDTYSYAVQRWLAPGQDADRYLTEHPTADLEIDVYLTPHNDLEDLQGKPEPAEARLRFEDAQGEAETEAASKGSKRGTFRTLKKLLFLNNKEVTLLRRIVTQLAPDVLSDSRSFRPSLRQRAPRLALRHLDLIEQTMERYANSRRELRLNIVVLPSIYDLPSKKYEYTWGAIVDQFANGAFRDPESARPVRVRNLRCRELFQRWHPTDEEYLTRFDSEDFHYSLKGQIDLCIAMAQLKGDLSSDWLEPEGVVSESKRATIHEKATEFHRGVMAVFAELDGGDG